MSIHIYLPTLHYINSVGLSRCTQVMWHTLQYQTWERSTSFLHSLQCTNIVILNRYLSSFKFINQLLNSSSTNPPPFLAWLTGHLHLRHFSILASFNCVRCYYSKVCSASTLVSRFGYTLLSDSGSTPPSPTQVPIYCPHLLQVFLKFQPRGIRTTTHPSCTIPHQCFSTVDSNPILLHAIILYGLLPRHFPHYPRSATPYLFTPTPFNSTQCGVFRITTK